MEFILLQKFELQFSFEFNRLFSLRITIRVFADSRWMMTNELQNILCRNFDFVQIFANRRHFCCQHIEECDFLFWIHFALFDCSLFLLNRDLGFILVCNLSFTIAHFFVSLRCQLNGFCKFEINRNTSIQTRIKLLKINDFGCIQKATTLKVYY